MSITESTVSEGDMIEPKQEQQEFHGSSKKAEEWLLLERLGFFKRIAHVSVLCHYSLKGDPTSVQVACPVWAVCSILYIYRIT